MTTDSVPKTAVRERDGWIIGGMAKGAGMLAPGLATMLVVITTDAVLDSAALDAALRDGHPGQLRPARQRRLHVDERPGDAAGERRVRHRSGSRRVRGRAERPVPRPRDAAAARRRGREPRHRDRGDERRHARTTPSRSAAAIARNNLFKAAVFGNDPNWGRVLAAIGTTQAAFDPYDVDVSMNGVRVCAKGEPGPAARRGRPHAARSCCCSSTCMPATPGRPSSPTTSRTTTCTRTRRTLMTGAIELEDLDPRAAGAEQKAATLIECLPWLKRFAGEIVVVKFGGNAMVDADLQRAFAEDMVYLRHVGIKPVVVHGGGPQISAMLDRLGIAERVRAAATASRRPRSMEVVRMVLTGQVSRELVTLINEHGPLASAISGEDAGLFHGRKRGVVVDGATRRHRAGRRRRARSTPQPVLAEVAAGRIPVVSSIAPDVDVPGQLAQRQRRLRGRRARRRARRREARRAHRCRRALPRLARPRLARLRDRQRRAARAAAVARERA